MKKKSIRSHANNPWISLTTAGRMFDLSAVAVGKILKEQNWRQQDGSPTEQSIELHRAQNTPLKGALSYYRWRQDMLVDLLQNVLLKAPKSRLDQEVDLLAENFKLIDKAREKMIVEGLGKMVGFRYKEFFYKLEGRLASRPKEYRAELVCKLMQQLNVSKSDVWISEFIKASGFESQSQLLSQYDRQVLVATVSGPAQKAPVSALRKF